MSWFVGYGHIPKYFLRLVLSLDLCVHRHVILPHRVVIELKMNDLVVHRGPRSVDMCTYNIFNFAKYEQVDYS